ncbi:MAG TPA: alkaline phosphatase family protein, partial [Thermoanaerobaculia bacterium]
RYDEGGLAGVMPAVAATLGVGPTAPTFPSARRAVVVLVDGLGYELIRRRGGHAPFLRSLLPAAHRITAGFPSTTATSMGTFGTGLPPGAHGLLGYEVLVPGEDRFVQIVSCNTHNITTLIKTITHEDGKYSLRKGTFVCMRRSNDVSQADSFVPAPNVGKHEDPDFGTHHARDAHHVFETLSLDLNVFSSAVKLNTQYMHSIWFNLELDRDITVEEVKKRLRDNPLVAVTDKRYANLIFSFGRDHGYYGRILSQTVAVMPTIAVRHKREVYGFCFTPQDGNSLLSSVAATLWLIDPEWESVRNRIQPIRRWLYREI